MLIYTASRVKQSLEAACCSNTELKISDLCPTFFLQVKSQTITAHLSPRESVNELCLFEFMPSPVTSKSVSVFLDGFNIIPGLIVESVECNKILEAQRESAELGKNSL